MANLWEVLTKKHKLPAGFPVPDGVREFVDGDRDDKTVLRVGIALGLCLQGHVITGLTANKELAELCEKALKKIEV